MTRLAPVVRISDLAVHCWCERTIVHVPPSEVRAGRTRTCGHPHCTPEKEPA